MTESIGFVSMAGHSIKIAPKRKLTNTELYEVYSSEEDAIIAKLGRLNERLMVLQRKKQELSARRI